MWLHASTKFESKKVLTNRRLCTNTHIYDLEINQRDVCQKHTSRERKKKREGKSCAKLSGRVCFSFPFKCIKMRGPFVRGNMMTCITSFTRVSDARCVWAKRKTQAQPKGGQIINVSFLEQWMQNMKALADVILESNSPYHRERFQNRRVDIHEIEPKKPIYFFAGSFV